MKAILTIATLLFAQPFLQAQTIAIPNFSFEGPTTPFADPNIDSWQKSTQPIWFDPLVFGGTWDQSTGVFANPAPAQPDHKFNIEGNQAVFAFALPEAALFQELSALYTIGQSYTLTAGFIGAGGNMLSGVTFDLMLYYRNQSNNIVPIATTSIVNNTTNFPDRQNFVDFFVTLPTVLFTDAWAGQAIGVQLLSTANFGNLGGYWDIDNVRLTAIPEPSSLGLLAVACGGLLLRRRLRKV